MATRYYSNVAPPTTLTAGINAITTTITIASAAGLPVFQPYTLVIDPDTITMELVQVNSAAGTTLTVTRAIDGTSASNHSAGAVVRHDSSARDFAESRAHEEADSGVHGVVGDLVGTTDTQTLSNKTLTNPIINTPTISDGTITNTQITTNDPVVTGNLTTNGDAHITGELNLDGDLEVGDGPGFSAVANINGFLSVQNGAEISTTSGIGTHLEVQKSLGSTGPLQTWTSVGGVSNLAIVDGDGGFDSQSFDSTTTTVLTASTGWTVQAATIATRKNGWVFLNGAVTRSGANITIDAAGAPSTGIIGMATLGAQFRPKSSQGVIYFHAGNSIATGTVRINTASTGLIELVRWQASQTISTGNVISFTLAYPTS